jgi:hypothetical protein
MLIEIAHKLGYKIEVLPFTIEETTSLLLRIASDLDNSTYFQSRDRNSIYYGCDRNNITGDGLVMIAHKFPERLNREFSARIIEDKVDEVLRTRAFKSDIYSKLKDRRNNPDGALHDSAALLYTRDKRLIAPHSFKDISSWFVSDSKGISENAKITDKNAPLIIRAEELLNILWLTHPVIDERALSKNIVTKAITSTLSQSMPSKKMLKAMDKTLDSLSEYPINTDDCLKIAANIACYDNTELKIITEKKHQREILDELHRASVIADERQKKQSEESSRLWELARLSLEESKRRELASVRILNAQEKDQMEIEKKNISLQHEIEGLEALLARDNESLTINYKDIDERIEIPTRRTTKGILVITSILNVCLFIPVSFIVLKNWSVLEPYIALVPFCLPLITYIVFALTYKEMKPNKIKEILNVSIHNRLETKNFRFLDRKRQLESRIAETEAKIGELKSKFIY